MDKVGRRVKGQYTEYPVYTREEADALGIQYRHWRETTAGSFGISDDGFVAECVQAFEYTDKKGRTRRLVTFPYGRGWANGKKTLEWLEHKRTGNFYGTSPKNWAEREARRTRTKNAVKVYVQMLLTTGKIDWDMVGNAYRPTEKIPAATVRKLFKNERIQAMIDAEVQKILKKQGITKETVVEMYKKAAEIAETKGDPKGLVTAADRLADLVDLNKKADDMGSLPDSVIEKMAERALNYNKPQELPEHAEVESAPAGGRSESSER